MEPLSVFIFVQDQPAIRTIMPIVHCYKAKSGTAVEVVGRDCWHAGETFLRKRQAWILRWRGTHPRSEAGMTRKAKLTEHNVAEVWRFGGLWIEVREIQTATGF
jgi:hypothetical protein